MTSPVEDVHGAQPPDTGVRIGTVTSLNATTVVVSVAGVAISCGFVDPGALEVGQPVAILRGSASWLALGSVSASAAPSDRVGFINVATGVGTNGTGNYIDVPGGNTFVAFNKLSATTLLRVDLHLTFFTDNNATGAEFGVSVNGVDTIVSQVHATLTALAHMNSSGTLGISGLPAGLWNVQARYRRSSGAGLINFNTDDRLSMAVTEVRV